MSSLRRAAALLLLVAYVLVATVGAGWVICVESDGNVALEPLAAGCCEDEPRETDCDGCDDTLLLETLAASDTASEALPEVLPPVRLASLWTPALQERAPSATSLPIRQMPPPRALHLAVTVLRL